MTWIMVYEEIVKEQTINIPLPDCSIEFSLWHLLFLHTTAKGVTETSDDLYTRRTRFLTENYF